ncbi:probable serine/threonine-protein kinase drkA isoform X2 [Dysidea avara]
MKQTQQAMQLESSGQISSTVSKPHQDTNEIERKVREINEMVQRMDINVRQSFQKSLDVQKSNEQLKLDNSNLQNGLSLAQQQLLDVKKTNNDLRTSMTNLQIQLSQNQNQFSITQKQSVDMQRCNEDLKASNALLLNQLSQMQNQLSITQQQFLDVQKEMKASNSFLQSQLSLTQQQLLGVQSMLTCSRLWVVSIDQLKIGKEIGRGAWATVHEATFREATVAAKCLHKLITAPRTRQLFQREMEMALVCQHQNIVTFLGATLEGPPVILMEMMDTSLRSAYEEEIVKDDQINGILHDVAKALHFLHTRPDPVIHRDVSSANVLLKVLYNGEWLAKLGDLGTAKIQQQVATAGPGAMAYGAPEAADYTKHSPKMDVYSFGVVVIETLTKTHPFQIVNSLKVQVQQQYPQYDQLVTSCTKQQSSDRPTMYDVLVQLDGIAAAKY